MKRPIYIIQNKKNSTILCMGHDSCSKECHPTTLRDNLAEGSITHIIYSNVATALHLLCRDYALPAGYTVVEAGDDELEIIQGQQPRKDPHLPTVEERIKSLEERVDDNALSIIQHADKIIGVEQRVSINEELIECVHHTTSRTDNVVNHLVALQKKRWDKVRKRLYALEEESKKSEKPVVADVNSIPQPSAERYFLAMRRADGPISVFSSYSFLCQGKVSGCLFSRYYRSLDDLSRRADDDGLVWARTRDEIAKRHLHLSSGFPKACLDTFHIISLSTLRKTQWTHLE